MIPAIAVAAVLVLASTWLGRRAWLERRSAARLAERFRELGSADPGAPKATPAPALPQAAFALACVIAVAGFGAAALAGFALRYAVAGGALLGAVAYVALDIRTQRARRALEEALGEVLALMGAALRVGVPPIEALERASREVGAPLSPLVDRLVARLRLGDDAPAALQALARQVPLESFRLFAVAVGVQWSAGASLDRALANLARTVQDRADLLRRVETQSAPTRASVFAIFGAVAFIAFLAWSNDPANVERFLADETGSWLVAASLLLQALALVWMHRLARVEA
jgi:Flp pilus assembly protein TadB